MAAYRIGECAGSRERGTRGAHAAFIAKRRETLKLLLALFFAGGGAYVAEQRLPWRAWNADYRTAVGERRTVMLADGTSIVLDTDSTIDIRYT